MTADKDALLREDEIELAYWRFDARRKGYSDWKGAPQSERDAFKAELRARITAALAEKDAGGWIKERISQLTAHRACCGSEHDPSQGKLHGCCVVCGVPWPCEYAGRPPSPLPKGDE